MILRGILLALFVALGVINAGHAQTTLVSPVKTITCAAGEAFTSLSAAGAFTCEVISGTGISQLTGHVLAGPGAGSQAATLNASCADLLDDGAGCTAGAASTGMAGIAKLHNVPVAVGWPAQLDPHNVVLVNIDQASTITKIVGVNEVLVGAAATLSVYKAASTVSCADGTILHSGTFDANASLDTNQELTLTATTLAAGDRICLQTTDSANWLAGAGVGTITVFLAPTP